VPAGFPLLSGCRITQTIYHSLPMKILDLGVNLWP